MLFSSLLELQTNVGTLSLNNGNLLKTIGNGLVRICRSRMKNRAIARPSGNCIDNGSGLALFNEGLRIRVRRVQPEPSIPTLDHSRLEPPTMTRYTGTTESQTLDRIVRSGAQIADHCCSCSSSCHCTGLIVYHSVTIHRSTKR